MDSTGASNPYRLPQVSLWGGINAGPPRPHPRGPEDQAYRLSMDPLAPQSSLLLTQFSSPPTGQKDSPLPFCPFLGKGEQPPTIPRGLNLASRDDPLQGLWTT